MHRRVATWTHTLEVAGSIPAAPILTVVVNGPIGELWSIRAQSVAGAGRLERFAAASLRTT
jgi:hypothetical protein